MANGESSRTSFFQWVSRPETETLMIYWFDAGKNIGGEAIYTKN